MPTRRKQNPQSLKQTVSTAITKIVWRVAIYIRLSKDDGNDESYSVKNQRERLNDTLEQLMLDEDGIEFVGYYIDDGFTGVDSDRDDFQRLLTDIHNGKVNCVLVKDLSRLSRNDWECKYYLQMLFVKMNVRFISLELPKLDSFKRPEGVYELDVSFQSMYNENHCRETSIKVRGTLDKKREKGQFIGAFAPYGYLKDPEDYHHLVVNPETAPVVKDIFRWYMEGMSKSAITPSDIPANLGYIDMNSLSELYDSEGYDFLDVYTHTPEEAKELMETIKNLPEVKGKTFTFNLNSEDFDLVSTPLSSFGSMVDTTVFILTIIGVLIVVLLLVLWTRGRKKEIGILLAVGRSKVEIVGQFLTENILITFLSMIVSAGLSITFADKIGAYIIQKAGESTTDLTISIATSDMVMVYSIGLALVCFSVLVASYTVIRLNPKDILSKMD